MVMYTNMVFFLCSVKIMTVVYRLVYIHAKKSDGILYILVVVCR